MAKGFLAVSVYNLIFATTANAAVVSLISPQDVPLGSPTVTFDGLNNSSFGGPTSSSYIEAGVTVVGSGPIFAYPTSGQPASDLWMSTHLQSLVFPHPVSFVAWQEYYGTNRSVSLFSDTDGLQVLGSFDVQIPWQAGSKRFHGFSSDTQFRRMTFLSVTAATHWVNNLQFTPEPTGLLWAFTAALLLSSHGLVTRRR